MGKCIFWSDCL